MTQHTIIIKWDEEAQLYIAYIPANGAVAQGESIEQAAREIATVAQVYEL